MGGWDTFYFSAVLVFGLAYYLRYRGGELNATASPQQASGSPVGAVLLITALIASLVFPLSSRRQSDWYQILMPLGVLGLGWAWYAINRTRFDQEAEQATPAGGDPNLERLGLALGLLLGLGLSIRNGLKGWCNIYLGNEAAWSRRLWEILGPVYLVALVAILLWVLFWPRSRMPSNRRVSRAYAVIWLVLIVQNVIAQLITGPLSEWNEVAFSIYYVLLFLISAVIVYHVHALRRHPT
jgi:hypothetical protein